MEGRWGSIGGAYAPKCVVFVRLMLSAATNKPGADFEFKSKDTPAVGPEIKFFCSRKIQAGFTLKTGVQFIRDIGSRGGLAHK